MTKERLTDEELELAELELVDQVVRLARERPEEWREVISDRYALSLGQTSIQLYGGAEISVIRGGNLCDIQTPRGVEAYHYVHAHHQSVDARKTLLQHAIHDLGDSLR